jgi:hypothetical protein
MQTVHLSRLPLLLRLAVWLGVLRPIPVAVRCDPPTPPRPVRRSRR